MSGSLVMPHGHVGGDGGPQGEGGCGLGGELGHVVKNLGATFSLAPRICEVPTLVTRNAIEH